MVDPWQLKQLRAGDALGQLAAVAADSHAGALARDLPELRYM
jgi:hypothetical protein